MTEQSEHVEEPMDAGEFSAWLGEIAHALSGAQAAQVPCGTCTACCTSSQFVHIAPDETDSLAHIPRALVFVAPGMPRGHKVLGYDERGHCPMLVDGACSIYEHRPRTCRTYDCRVFAATGLEPGEPGKALIAARVRRWTFQLSDPAAATTLEAVTAAATYLGAHPGVLPRDLAPITSTQRAVMAVDIHEAFLAHDAESGAARVIAEPEPAVVLAAARQTRPGARPHTVPSS